MIRIGIILLFLLAIWIVFFGQAGASGDDPALPVKRFLWPHNYPPPMPGIGIGSPGETRQGPPAPVPLPKAAPVKKNAPAAKRRRPRDDDD